MKRRIFSLLATVLFCFVLLPVSALADGAASATSVNWNGHRYLRIDQGMTWKEAKAYCEGLGGHLATITSAQEQQVIMDLIADGTQAQYWLGGTDEEKQGEWKWITGEPWTYWYTTVTFNNYQGTEHYLQMERHHWGDSSRLGVWNDINNENYIRGETSFFSTELVGILCEFEQIGSDWAQPELQKAEELGLIPDCLENTDLSQPISRLEFAAVAVKTYEALSGTKAIPIVNNPFTDCNDLEVLKAYGIGAVNGTSSITFSPNDLLTREQAATMLTRVFKHITLAGWTLATDSQFTLPYTKPSPFADDANISSWAKDSVYFMAANDIINGVGGNRFAPKNITTEEEAVGFANATREQALLIAVRMVEKLG